jgi:hypothetical protein
MAAAVMIVLIVLMLVMAYLATKEISAWSAVLLALLILLCGLFLLFWKRLRVWSLQWQLRRRREAFDPHSLSICEEGVSTTVPSGTFLFRWHVVRSIVEHRDHVFFYVSKVEAYVLPKSAFVDAQEARRFVQTARRYHEEARRFVRTEDDA